MLHLGEKYSLRYRGRQTDLFLHTCKHNSRRLAPRVIQEAPDAVLGASAQKHAAWCVLCYVNGSLNIQTALCAEQGAG